MGPNAAPAHRSGDARNPWSRRTPDIFAQFIGLHGNCKKHARVKRSPRPRQAGPGGHRGNPEIDASIERKSNIIPIERQTGQTGPRWELARDGRRIDRCFSTMAIPRIATSEVIARRAANSSAERLSIAWRRAPRRRIMRGLENHGEARCFRRDAPALTSATRGNDDTPRGKPAFGGNRLARSRSRRVFGAGQVQKSGAPRQKSSPSAPQLLQTPKPRVWRLGGRRLANRHTKITIRAILRRFVRCGIRAKGVEGPREIRLGELSESGGSDPKKKEASFASHYRESDCV